MQPSFVVYFELDLPCWWGLEYADCIPLQRGKTPPKHTQKGIRIYWVHPLPISKTPSQTHTEKGQRIWLLYPISKE